MAYAAINASCKVFLITDSSVALVSLQKRRSPSIPLLLRCRHVDAMQLAKDIRMAVVHVPLLILRTGLLVARAHWAQMKQCCHSSDCDWVGTYYVPLILQHSYCLICSEEEQTLLLLKSIPPKPLKMETVYRFKIMVFQGTKNMIYLEVDSRVSTVPESKW